MESTNKYFNINKKQFADTDSRHLCRVPLQSVSIIRESILWFRILCSPIAVSVWTRKFVFEQKYLIFKITLILPCWNFTTMHRFAVMQLLREAKNGSQYWNNHISKISIYYTALPRNQLVLCDTIALSLLQQHHCGQSGGVLKYIFYYLRDTSASLESLICPSVEPRLCITPPGKGMKASLCHGVVSSRLMVAVARDLHSVGGLCVWVSILSWIWSVRVCVCWYTFSRLCLYMCVFFCMRKRDCKFMTSTWPWSTVMSALHTQFVCLSALLMSPRCVWHLQFNGQLFYLNNMMFIIHYYTCFMLYQCLLTSNTCFFIFLYIFFYLLLLICNTHYSSHVKTYSAVDL